MDVPKNSKTFEGVGLDGIPARPGDPLKQAAAFPKAGTVDAQRVIWSLRSRINAIAWAKADKISWLLDQYELGGMDITRLWNTIQRRCEVTHACWQKRTGNVGRLAHEIVIPDSIPDKLKGRAQQHAEKLKDFFANITVTDALRQDVCGRVPLLMEQMMASRLMGYASHEMVWQPPSLGKGLSARFVFCPPWWFEARLGKLRFLPADWQYYGDAMEPGAWLITANPHGALMESLSILWLFKRYALQDWASFIGRYGQPFIDAATNASIGSPEWDSLVEFVRNAGDEGGIVHNNGSTINLKETGGTADQLHWNFEQTLSRKMTALILGADLATQSREGTGATGASLQGQEPVKLQEDDCGHCAGVINIQVVPEVIQYYFGPNEQPLAVYVLPPPQNKDMAIELQIDNAFAAWGLPRDRSEIYNTYSRKEPSGTDSVVLNSGARGDSPGGGTGPTNSGDGAEGDGGSKKPSDLSVAMANEAVLNGAAAEARLATAARDRLAARLDVMLKPIRTELERIGELPEASAREAAVLALNNSLPERLKAWGIDEHLVGAFEDLIGTALINGVTSGE